MSTLLRSFKSIKLFYIFILLFAIFLFQCGTKDKSYENINIRLKWLHQAQFAGFYYAKEAKLYDKRGLNVILRPGGIDYPAIQMVVSGSDHFGVTGADQILIARERGIPIVAVACIYRKSPFVLFALKNSGIKKVEDFYGKRIGVKFGGNEELTYRAMLKKAGISSSDFTEIPVKFDISLLLAGKVDIWPGYSINEPITAEEKGFSVNLIWSSDYGINLYADVLFTTEEMIKMHPDIVRGIVEGTIAGWSNSFENREQAITYTLKYSKELTRDHEIRMLNASFPLVIPDDKPIGWMEMDVWKEMYKILKDSGFLKEEIDLSKAFSTDFVRK